MSLGDSRTFLQGGNDRERQVSLVDIERSLPSDILLWEVSNRHLRDRAVPVDVGILTNITKNHIEDHGSWSAYVEAKLRLPREALSNGGDAIVSSRDPVTRDHLAQLRKLPGSLWVVGEPEAASQHEGAGWLDDDRNLLVKRPGSDEVIHLGHATDLPIKGEHNLDNLLSALCASLAIGAEPQSLVGTVASFGGLTGRLEEVANERGVRWVYDIQATTAPAAEAGIAAMAGEANQLVLLVGGEDKGMDYSGMAEAASSAHARVLALPGSGTASFLRALSGRCPVEHFEELDPMIERAGEVAEHGDIILLSPGCAFFHRDYIEPGKPFARRVREFLVAERA